MNKVRIFKIFLIIIICLLLVAIYKEFNEYIYEEKKIEASAGYNEEQKKCEVVGTTNNYIYISRYKDKDEMIGGAIWELTDIKGNTIGTFETNDSGNGGVVGLEYGEYYLQEKSVPEGYEKTDKKYKVIISAIDTEYKLEVYSGTDVNAIIFVATDENGNPVEGIKYNIYNNKGEKINDATTNKDGLAGIKDLPPGVYMYSEANTDTDDKYFFEIKENSILRVDLEY